MSRIIDIMRRDFGHVRGNVIAILVCMGLIVLPSLYAWFNIAGGWDPYGNTGQVRVALANSDEGVRGSIIPFRINVGERVVSSLTGSTKIGYVVTSEDKAIDGVRSGEYYAAVVIPKNFSSNLLSVLTKTPTHPQLDYYVNEKRNAIASIVTGKASGSVQNLVNTGFTEAVAEVATDLFGEVSGVLDDEGVLTLGSGMGTVLQNSLHTLERSANDLDAYAGVVGSIRSVMDSSTALFGDGSASVSASGLLSESADGVRQFDEAANTAKEAVDAAVSAGSSSLEDVEAAIGEALDAADGKTDQLEAALGRVKDVAQSRRDDLQKLLDKLNDLNGQVVDLERSLEVGNASIKVAYTVENDLSDLITRTSNAISYMDDLISTCDTTMGDLQTTRSNAQDAREELQSMAAQASDSVESMRRSYEDNLSGSLASIASTIDDAASEADAISTSIHDEADKLESRVGAASKDLKDLEDSLTSASKRLHATSKKLAKTRKRILRAVSSQDAELVRTILGGDAAALASFLSSPVQLDREAFFPVQNNGSAMTPYYTTMALWVGGTLMGVLLYAGLSKKALKQAGAQPRHAYFGRLGFFLAIGACQSTLLLLGDLFLLGIQCQNPVLFLLTGWLASTVFINIIYSLATSFGDVGKAIAVFVMVLQVAGSGGTFPVEMLPAPFQLAYPFLPFVHSENAMRAAMFGVYGNDWLMEMGLLAAFLVPALILGLALRKPFVPVNEWIEQKMEETKLM